MGGEGPQAGHHVDGRDGRRVRRAWIANPFEIEHYLLAPMRVGPTLVGLLSVDYGRGAEPPAVDDVALVEAVAKLADLLLERDRLQRERAEARTNEMALRAANRRKDEFLGVASHELRTPLTGLRGSLQIMQHGQVGVESAPRAGATFWLALPLAAPDAAGRTP